MIKNSPEKNSVEKVFHIYLKDECVLNSLSEEKFNESWEILSSLVGLMRTDYVMDDLSYEEVEAHVRDVESSY